MIMGVLAVSDSFHSVLHHSTTPIPKGARMADYKEILYTKQRGRLDLAYFLRR